MHIVGDNPTRKVNDLPPESTSILSPPSAGDVVVDHSRQKGVYSWSSQDQECKLISVHPDCREEKSSAQKSARSMTLPISLEQWRYLRRPSALNNSGTSSLGWRPQQDTREECISPGTTKQENNSRSSSNFQSGIIHMGEQWVIPFISRVYSQGGGVR